MTGAAVLDAARRGGRDQGPVSEFSRQLGAFLRVTRKRRGLSLHDVQVVSRGHWKATTIRSWEAGVREIAVETLAELAAFYGVPVTALIPDQP